MSKIDDQVARRVNRYGAEIGGDTGGTPGRSTVTARMPASARSIARAVMAEMSGVAPGADALVARAAESGGHGLPADLRGRFESSLGADLGGVRVHTDSHAAAAASSLGARAYATGQDVYMGAGQYAPSTPDGAWLLAHEVAHTVQQRGASEDPACKLEVSEPGDAMETEADAAATAMLSGLPASVSSSSGVARRISRDIGPPRPSDAAGHAGRWQGRIEHDMGIQMALTQYFKLEHVRYRIQFNGEIGDPHAEHPAAGVSGSSMGVTDGPQSHGSADNQDRATVQSTSRNGQREDTISVQRQHELGDAFHHLLRFRATGGGSIGRQGANGSGYLFFGGAAELGSLMSLDLQVRAIEQAPGEARLRFMNLRAALMTNPLTLRYTSPEGWYMQGSFQIGLEARIAPNWENIIAQMRQWFTRVSADAAADAAPGAASAGAGEGGASAGAGEGGAGAGAGEGGAGAGAGTAEGGAGAGETAAAGGGAEAGIELAISAGFIAGAIVTIAATVASLVEGDAADAAARRVPTVADTLANGFIAGMRGDPQPGDRTQAIGWERGVAERVRTIDETVRAHPGTSVDDYTQAVTDATDARRAALAALARRRFWRLAQAIVWHGYARGQHGIGAQHALDLGWRYIFQGETDAELQRLYHQYADHL